MRLDNTVIIVTDKNITKSLDYNINSTNSDNLYRLYERGDTWGCNNCMDKGDKWYMLKHNCKRNKK